MKFQTESMDKSCSVAGTRRKQTFFFLISGNSFKSEVMDVICMSKLHLKDQYPFVGFSWVPCVTQQVYCLFPIQHYESLTPLIAFYFASNL